MPKSMQPKRLRHPSSGGYARGSETRQRIIDSAIELFGESGYESTSTRQIAKKAGVNPPALQYYFDNKEGLYIACTASLVEENQAWLQPFLARTLVKDSADTDTCIETLCQMLDSLLERILSKNATSGQRLFYARMRLGQGPGKTAEDFSNKLFGQLFSGAVKLVARICDSPMDDEMVQLRTLSLLGQVTTFHVLRHTLFPTLTETGSVTAEKKEMIKKCIREQSLTLMHSWRKASEKSSPH
ncbi:TetR/AcrR family transcriptional regulator [Sodalis ligni]|jgi:AcrR family transcriptional regulator|uniref:TetR family transcriptional regulator n=1 Tax=Sodalis ligni TaxID=2697027 RepID=A0A4R1NLY7_9GAMM|nr:CerR family C-terminal domain-containing protein [Sodalis ligni]TCL05816.1 TetR family transcriptional regulator [Sodalis ligni]